MPRPRKVWHTMLVSNVYYAELKEIVGAARRRAEKKSVPYCETLFDHVSRLVIAQDGHCRCCDAKFQRGTRDNGGAPTSLTIHRIFSPRGYVPGNVAVICKQCNDDIGECPDSRAIARKRAALDWQLEKMVEGAH